MSRFREACALLAGSGFVLSMAALVRGQDADADLRIPQVSAEPGEEVALEFRATVRQPILLAVIRFASLDAAADFLGVSAEGTAAAGFEPRGVGYSLHSPNGGSEVFVRGDTRQPYDAIATGSDVLLVKAIVRVRADAQAGDYPLKVLAADFSGIAANTLKVSVEAESRLTVLPASRPRPAGSLQCGQEGADVVLTWINTEVYDAIDVSRNGGHVTTLPGSATSFRHAPPIGPAAYSVVATRAGQTSLAASCNVLVQTPRPAAVTGLACQAVPDGVNLAWSNSAAYESLHVFRNQREIVTLPAGSVSYHDPWSSSLFTIYAVKGAVAGIDSNPATCRVNEQSGDYIVWADDVRVQPGDVGVIIRVFCTNPQPLQGAQIALRIDPAFIRLRELTLDGTASEVFGYDQFLYQHHVLDRGETACGIYYDSVPPYGILFPAGADQHLLSIIVDVAAGAPTGTIVEVRFNGAGSPVLDNALTVDGQGHFPDSRSGAILIGASPVPEVANAEARLADDGAGDGGGAAEAGISLHWANRDAYSEVRVERDGRALATLPGSASSFEDSDPGPGVHRYRIFAVAGGTVSFPVVVTSRPRGVPGTFLRGDATADGAVNITDAAQVLLYLFQGGREPACLDAADTDDNGHIDLADPLTLLNFLFLGSTPLSEPGTVNAWFDPTPDELGCG